MVGISDGNGNVVTSSQQPSAPDGTAVGQAIGFVTESNENVMIFEALASQLAFMSELALGVAARADEGVARNTERVTLSEERLRSVQTSMDVFANHVYQLTQGVGTMQGADNPAFMDPDRQGESPF
mgnify:CR=1 FL=1